MWSRAAPGLRRYPRLRRIAHPASFKAGGVDEGTGGRSPERSPALACDPGLRRKKGAKLRFGRVRERGVSVVGAVRHVYAAVVELSAQCWDTKEAAVLNYGVAREVAGNEEGLVPIVVRGKRDRGA